MTSSTVVTVNFRLGATENASSLIDSAEPEPELVSNSESHSTNFHKYPTPIHDTLAGFDWIRKNLQPTKLAVFGSHVGGSLALMLALTEPQSVHAVAAYEPICDWPGLDDHCAHETITDSEFSSKQKRSRRRKPAAPDLVPLLEAREQLFTSFERCFDAFASPILFLRAAGRDIPKTFPQYLTGLNYPRPVLKNTTKAKITEGSDSPDASSRGRNAYSGSDTDEHTDLPVRRRKALCRWPPHGLDYGLNNEPGIGPDHGIDRLEVTLPWVRVFLNGPAGSTEIAASSKTSAMKSTVLEQQGEEMVSVMRKTCFWGHEKSFGERVVTLSRVDDFSGQELASYFDDVFEKESSDDD
ncbi:hypothetical protein N7454_008486 [Penicillium verhagenii]|nr:hypothetical protein N7454_008486 [Penicillium verhagenii]